MFGSVRVRVALTVGLLALLFSSPVWSQSDAGALLQRADADARAGRYEAGREAYTAAIRRGASLDSDATRSHLLAQCYANASPVDFNSAVRWYRNALRLNGDERVRAELADTLVRAGQFEEAAEQYQVLSQIHPASTIYMIALSRALLQAGRAEDALQTLQAWLARNPGVTAVRLEYARILSYQKHFAEARQQYEFVLKSEPTNLIAQIGVAKVTSWQGDQEAALPMYERVLSRNPSNYDALVGKAFSLLWMGRRDEALPLLQTAARRNPGDADVREALSHLGGAAVMPPIAAAPPSLPEVPAAAPFTPSEAAPRTTAPPPINVPPPTSLPEVTEEQRSAGKTAFVPGPRNEEPQHRRAKPARAKAASKEQDQAAAPAPEQAEAVPETNVFGFTGVSNAKLVIIFFILAVLLSMAVFVMSTRDKDATGDGWHDKPRSAVQPSPVRATRAYQQKPVTRPAPPMAPVRPVPPVDSNAQPDYTLAGVPRRTEGEEVPASARVSPRMAYRAPVPEQHAPTASPTFVTQIQPRVVEPETWPAVRLNGLRVLLVGADEELMETERRALQGAGAEVMLEASWANAVTRMTSDGVHAIVLNEGAGNQTQRIYQSVVQQYPGWLRRMLLVLAEDNATTRLFMSTCQAKCMLQPFQSIELLTRLSGMFGMTAHGTASGKQ